MTRIIAVTNNKGGVGKTHTVFHLSGALSETGKKVLAIDLDPQANLTSLFTLESFSPTLYEVLIDDVPISEAVHKTNFDLIYLVPASKRLQAIDAILKDEPDAQIRLADALQELNAEAYAFDYVLLDCPPNIGLTTRNALAAAHWVIIPIEADKFSIDGLDNLVHLIKTAKRVVNRKLEIAGILISLFNGRRSIEQLYAEVLKEKGLPLFETKIKDSSKYREAIANKKPITHYKPRSEHAEAFRALRDELEKVYVN
jgi:chromosome partitioning protein